jgi:hypothetical protein
VRDKFQFDKIPLRKLGFAYGQRGSI